MNSKTFRAEHEYKIQKGKPKYRQIQHPGIPRRFKPFIVQMPIHFFPWDKVGGVLAFPSSNPEPFGICRCGLVEKTTYFRLKSNGSVLVGLKIMTKEQIRLQNDDIDNELRIMSQLQPAGLSHPRANPHFLVWECAEDAHNEYIATEFAVNGSLQNYARESLRVFKKMALQTFVDQANSKDELKSMVQKSLANTWMIHGLGIFHQIMSGIAYMHAQNVCHLDLDPYNVVLDDKSIAKIIDFGSSEILDHKGHAGVGNSLVKYKPLFVSPEVRKNNAMSVPRPGFDGRAADMWSAGTMLYQIVCWGCPAGNMVLSHDVRWRFNLFRHIRKEHPREGEECFLCYRKFEIPEDVLTLLEHLLDPNPRNRWSAVQAAMHLKTYMKSFGSFGRVSVPPFQDPFDMKNSTGSSAPALL